MTNGVSLAPDDEVIIPSNAGAAATRPLAALLESSSDFMAIASPTGRVLVLNGTARQQLGRNRNHLNGGQHLRDILDEPSRRVLEEEALPQAKTCGGWTGRLVVLGQAGPMPLDVLLLLHSERGEAAQFVSFVGRPPESESVDIERLRRDRLRAIEELMDNRASLEEAQALARVGSWEWDAETGRIRWSKALFDIHYERFGENPPEAETYLSRVHEEDRDIVSNIVNNARSAGRTMYEYRYVLPTGEMRHLRGVAEFVERADGRKRVRGTIQDVTDDKRARDLLVRAREEAIEASKAKSRFLANMSHEIRTPMNGIVGMASLLAETSLDARQFEYLSAIQRSAANLLGVINDILDLAKIEAGKMELRPEDFAPEKVVTDAVTDLAARAYARNVELVVSVAQDVPERVVGDCGRFRQVVVNLVSNAIKFTTVGEVEVSLDVVGLDLQVSVRDTGLGIPGDQIAAIFEPFTQVDDSSTRTVGGTGLGLAISQELVHRMGGRIWVESTPGSGSTFHFTIRLDAIDFATQKPRLAIKNLTVLVLEPNVTVRRSIAGSLRGLGALPAQCGDVGIARAWLAETSGDRVIMIGDIGEDDLRAVDAAARAQNVRVVRVIKPGASSDAVPGDVTIVKPVSRETVHSCLTTLFSARKQGPRPAQLPPKAQRRRVLVAEDNDVNAMLVQHALEKDGHEVVRVATGRAAVDASAARDYDVIFMDVHMPEMDGYEATRAIRLREMQSHKHVPIIALTASAMKGDEDKCRGVGMDDYLAKPVTASALRKALEPLPAAAPATFDHDALLERTGGDASLSRRMLEMFLERADAMGHAVEEALVAADWERVRFAAHAAKGAAAAISGETLRTAAAALEHAARAADEQAVREGAAWFRSALASLTEALRQELGR